MRSYLAFDALVMLAIDALGWAALVGGFVFFWSVTP